MSGIKIINIKSGEPYDLYCGRANKYYKVEESKWHNPFPMKNESERISCCENFRKYLLSRKDLIDALYELDNKTLACWCFPRSPCHLEILREEREMQLQPKIITITEISNGCEKIKFEPSVVVEFYSPPSLFVLDFGMEIHCGLKDCYLNKGDSLFERAKNTITWELEHAFFHCPKDPNYTAVHWALYGNLKDRATTSEISV